MKTQNYVSIPYTIMYRTDLTDKQKMVYGIVEGYKNSKGFCYIKNPAIAEIICSSVKTVSRAIKKLDELGLITIHCPKGRKRWLSIGTPVSDIKQNEHITGTPVSHKRDTDDGLVGHLRPRSGTPVSHNNLDNLINKPTLYPNNTSLDKEEVKNIYSNKQDQELEYFNPDEEYVPDPNSPF